MKLGVLKVGVFLNLIVAAGFLAVNVVAQSVSRKFLPHTGHIHG